MTIMEACATTKYETKIEYVVPEIPQSMLSPCKEVQYSFETNGELLMSYISLQSAYLECATKVVSIVSVIKSYKDVFNVNSEE